MPLLAVGLYAAPAFAGLDDVGDTKVKNYNTATVGNYLKVKADTGDNHAGGSTGGDGGSGGDIENSGTDQDVDKSSTGNGGNGGSASDGGLITTGSATAWGKIKNVVNKNDTEINRCTCNGDKDKIEGNDKVKNENTATVGNEGKVKADTGDNHADGSEGGAAGNAGDIENTGGEQDVDESHTGSGGAGGAGALGGLVVTGPSDASGEIVNIVNKNITRILR